jgi:hypothetical protein
MQFITKKYGRESEGCVYSSRIRKISLWVAEWQRAVSQRGSQSMERLFSREFEEFGTEVKGSP